MSGYLNPATGRAEPAEGVDGAVQVRPVSAVGSQFRASMVAVSNAAAPAPANHDEVHSNATGYKLVRWTAAEDIVSAVPVLVGWSTTEDDTTVESNLAAAQAKATGSSQDGTWYPNQGVLTKEVPFYEQAWDGVSPIKRFAATNSAATEIALEVVVVAAD